MPGLIDANTGLAEGIGTGLIWLAGGLGEAGGDIIIIPFDNAFQADAFQEVPLAFQIVIAVAFQSNAFQNDAFKVI